LLISSPGITTGIGETTVKTFAKHAASPRIYLTGRSQEAGDRIVGECKTLNPNGTYIFIKAETSLLRNVDKLCDEIKAQEKSINVLFLSVGTLMHGQSRSFIHGDRGRSR
jgi:short-subunit dehydrogenase